MTRPRKQTVDYFPHYCHHGKTMTVLDQKYGNDGYAFWFRVLELLGSSEGHYLDCNDSATWEYLQSVTHLEADKCLEILNLLARLQAIDIELWEAKIVWSENFVQGISQAYRNRIVDIPPKPVIQRKKSTKKGVSDVRNPNNEVKGKERNKKRVKVSLPENFSISPQVRSWAQEQGFANLEEHLEYFKNYAQANGKEYADWDAAFRNAVKGDWGNIRKNGGNGRESPRAPCLPKEPEGILVFDPKCPVCHGDGFKTMGKCKCARTQEEINASQKTAASH